MKITFILSNITIQIPLNFNGEIIMMRIMVLAGRPLGMRFGHEGRA